MTSRTLVVDKRPLQGPQFPALLFFISLDAQPVWSDRWWIRTMTPKFGIILRLLALTTSVNAVWPIPESYKKGDKIAWLSPDVILVFNPALNVCFLHPSLHFSASIMALVHLRARLTDRNFINNSKQRQTTGSAKLGTVPRACYSKKALYPGSSTPVGLNSNQKAMPARLSPR